MTSPPRVPECDCYTTHKGPRLHRPGCPRLLAIVSLYRPNDPLVKDPAKR